MKMGVTTRLSSSKSGSLSASAFSAEPALADKLQVAPSGRTHQNKIGARFGYPQKTSEGPGMANRSGPSSRVQFSLRNVCVQFQPDRVLSTETSVRAAFRQALPDAEFIDGDDDGRYSNIMFEAKSPQDA